MPLPAAGMPWPPPEHAAMLAKMAEHDAWYSGATDRLRAIYERDVDRPKVRPSQMRGGIVGRVARWFWGEPTPLGERPNRLHVPVAADLATVSSDLLFAEAPNVRLGDGTAGSPERDRLDTLLELLGWDRRLAEAAETCAALGGTYLVAGWDLELAGRPLLTVAQADDALPDFRSGVLAGVTFVTVIRCDGDRVRRWVQRYEPGVILHGLYDGSSSTLGRPVSLEADPATAGMPDQVETPDGRMLVAYVPNMLPNRLDRHSPIGRSDYASNEPLFDRLDEVYTSWMRDIRLAKARLLVPSAYLTNDGPGQGASFDVDREVYAQLNIPPNMGGGTGAPITPSQFAIRVQEHKDTAGDLLGRIVSTAGYSAATFGLEGGASGGSMTATEVEDRNARSLATRSKKIGYWRPALADTVANLAAIDRAFFGGPGIDPAALSIVWPKGTQDSILQLAQTAQALRTAEAASDDTLVRLVHPDWDDDQVRAEVALIAASRPAVADPFGGPGA